MLNYTTWKLLMESLHAKSWLQEIQNRFTDIGTVMAMADELADRGDDSNAELLRLSLELIQQPAVKGNVLERYHKLKFKKIEELKTKNIYVSENNNEVIHWVGKEGEEIEYYYWNGSNIRVRMRHGPYRTIQLNDIDNPDIIEGIVVIVASKIVASRLGVAHGLSLPKTKKGHTSKAGRQLERQYLARKEESLMRAYLSRFLFIFTQCEDNLTRAARLQRNRPALHDLSAALHYDFDEEAIIHTINSYKQIHGGSIFLSELATRIERLITSLPEGITGPNVEKFHHVAEAIRKP